MHGPWVSDHWKKWIIWFLIGIGFGVGMMQTPMTAQTGFWSAVVMVGVAIGLMRYCSASYGRHALLWVWIVAILGVTIEYVWLKTCLPYGCFWYTEMVGPRVFGTFPLSLFVIRPLIVASMNQFVPTKGGLLKKSIVGWLILMLFDLLLDPVAVSLWLREYSAGGVRFGVPRTNYLGRLVTGMLSSWMFHKWSDKLLPDRVLCTVWWVLRGMYGSGFALLLFL